MKDLKHAIAAYDMDGVFIIPMDYDGDLPKQDSSSHDLFLDANKLELDTVIKGNKFYYSYGAEYHAENIKWSGEKILDSCSKELKEKNLRRSTRLSGFSQRRPSSFQAYDGFGYSHFRYGYAIHCK